MLNFLKEERPYAWDMISYSTDFHSSEIRFRLLEQRSEQEACGIAWNSMRLVRRCFNKTQREPDNLVVNITNLTWLAQMHIYVQRALLVTFFIHFRYVLCFLLHVKTVHLYFKIFNHIPQTMCMLQIHWPRRWRTVHHRIICNT